MNPTENLRPFDPHAINLLGNVEIKADVAEQRARFKVGDRSYVMTLKVKDRDLSTLTEKDWIHVANKVIVMLAKKRIFESKDIHGAKIDNTHVRPLSSHKFSHFDETFSHDKGVRTRDDYEELVQYLFKSHSISKPIKDPQLPPAPVEKPHAPAASSPIQSPLPKPAAVEEKPQLATASKATVVAKTAVGLDPKKELTPKALDFPKVSGPSVAEADYSKAITVYHHESSKASSPTYKVNEAFREYFQKFRPQAASSKTSDAGAIVPQGIREKNKDLGIDPIVARIRISDDYEILLNQEAIEAILTSQKELEELMAQIEEGLRQQKDKAKAVAKEPISTVASRLPIDINLAEHRSKINNRQELVQVLFGLLSKDIQALKQNQPPLLKAAEKVDKTVRLRQLPARKVSEKAGPFVTLCRIENKAPAAVSPVTALILLILNYMRMAAAQNKSVKEESEEPTKQPSLKPVEHFYQPLAKEKKRWGLANQAEEINFVLYNGLGLTNEVAPLPEDKKFGMKIHPDSMML